MKKLHEKPEVRYYELQKIRSRLIRVSILLLTISFIIYYGNGAMRQLFYGQPWGKTPLSNEALIVTGVVILFFMLALCFFFFSIRLIVKLDNRGIYINLFPLARRYIPYEEIRKCRIVTYNALSDYGGWGAKSTSTGKIYTLYGDKGIELELKDGSTVLIGTQRSEELYDVIRSAI